MEHDESELGQFEMELEVRFGIEDLTPEQLEREFKRRVARKEVTRDEQTGKITFRLRTDDRTNLLLFKQFAKRYLFLFSGVAIVIASALTAVIIVTRQAIRDTGKSFKSKKNAGKGDTTPGEDIGPSGGGEIIPDTLDWVSDNLLTVTGLIILALLLYNR